MSKRELITSYGVLVLIIIALALRVANPAPQVVQATRDSSPDYRFTNPILDYENEKMSHVSLFSESVEKRVDNLRKKYGLSFASVYFRDMNDGQWIGVNEKEPLASASLVKLPILLSVYKHAENNPSVLDKNVTITEDDMHADLEQNIRPEKELLPGETYTVRELAEKMIIESDNIATQALLRAVPEERSQIYKAVGVNFEDKDNEVMVNVKNYAGFFRVLFNATYLDRENSEKALGILSRVKFTQGLVAGVPEGTLVAHKFGERATNFNGIEGSRQLHDCGIIYYPGNPYILCVMTRGTDFSRQEKFIAEVSSYFYNEVRKSL